MSGRRSALLVGWMGNTFSWVRILLDSGLALVCVLLITVGIAHFQLYPRIPTVPLVYLLVVLALVSLRGEFAAIVASLLAFCAFDFFLVPPLYTFVVGKVDDLLALFVFLATAIITGRLASALRHRAEQAHRREQETRLLYELGRAVESQDTLPGQLRVVAQSVINAFSLWGVRDCFLLLPDAGGKFLVQGSRREPGETLHLSSDERAAAAWVMQQSHSVDVYDGSEPLHRTGHTVVRSTASEHGTVQFVRFVPLVTNHEVVGVMRLLIEGKTLGDNADVSLGAERDDPSAAAAFFWTFVDQATFLIERIRWRDARLHIQALEETDTLRAALLSSVSHDLRTPLAIMKAATSSLLKEDMQWDEEARRSFLLSIEREIERLNRLVSNLLDLSRIEGNALKPEKEWYLIDELIHDVVDRLQTLLQDRQVQTHLPDDLPPVEIDYLAIDQVLTNLIENAVRYTPTGSPLEISAQVEGDQMRISVADRGPGIPPGELERIFDKFYRVLDTQERALHRSGSGLGLAVCRGLVEAHGGHIWAENREGGGAVFIVDLPIGPKEPEPEQKEDGGDEEDRGAYSDR